MISVDSVTIRFGGFVLFDGVSFQVNPGDRIGLVGRNGAGKTTILNLIAGKQEPDEGRVVKTSGKTVGYLPQQMKHKKGKTLYKETLDAFKEVLQLQERIKMAPGFFNHTPFVIDLHQLPDDKQDLDFAGTERA